MITGTTAVFIFAAFVVGYLVGRLDRILIAVSSSSSNVAASTNAPQSFFSKKETGSGQNNPARQTATIDDRLYVPPIATNTLTKTNNAAIGKTSETEDNIAQSVSKLSQLKAK